MPNISKIKLENGIYDIKDEISRNEIQNTNNNIGNLDELTTQEKNSVVNSINSLKSYTDTKNLEINNLIANVQTSLNNTNNQLEEKANNLNSLIIFGDSWSDPTVTDAIWGNMAGNELNLNVFNYAKSSAFMTGSDDNSLQSQVQNFNNDNLANKSKVKFIVILGGINDFRHNVTWSELYTKLQLQIELLKTYCPQAKILYVSNCQWYYDKAQGDYWCGIHQQLRASERIVTYNIFGTFGKEMYNSGNYFHLNQIGQKIMCSNIIASLTGGEIQYFQDEIVLDNSDANVHFFTQRIKNFVFLHWDITAKTAFTSTSFNNPTGYYFPYYPLLGGWSDRNFRQFAFDLDFNKLTFAVSNAVDIGKVYHGDAIIPLIHL